MILLEQGWHIPYGKAAKELQSFIRALKEKLPYQVYSQLLQKTDNLQRTDELYRFIARLGKEYHPGLSVQYPALSEFLAYTERSASVNPIELINEEKRLLEELRTALAEDEGEKEVAFLSAFAGYFEDYLYNRLSAGDYDYFNARFPQFRRLWAKYAKNNTLQELSGDLELLNTYYEINNQRNACFVNTLLADGVASMNTASSASETTSPDHLLQDKQLIVIVTGGFHTYGLQKLLAGRKISSLAITPNVTQDTKASSRIYLELAREQAKILAQTLAQEACADLIRSLKSKTSVNDKIRISDLIFRHHLIAGLRFRHLNAGGIEALNQVSKVITHSDGTTGRQEPWIREIRSFSNGKGITIRLQFANDTSKDYLCTENADGTIKIKDAGQSRRGKEVSPALHHMAFTGQADIHQKPATESLIQCPPPQSIRGKSQFIRIITAPVVELRNLIGLVSASATADRYLFGHTRHYVIHSETPPSKNYAEKKKMLENDTVLDLIRDAVKDSGYRSLIGNILDTLPADTVFTVFEGGMPEGGGIVSPEKNEICVQTVLRDQPAALLHLIIRYMEKNNIITLVEQGGSIEIIDGRNNIVGRLGVNNSFITAGTGRDNEHIDTFVYTVMPEAFVTCQKKIVLYSGYMDYMRTLKLVIEDPIHSPYSNLFRETKEILDEITKDSPIGVDLYFIDDTTPNAFSISGAGSTGIICITTGFFKALMEEGLTKDAIAFVLAHEFRHEWQAHNKGRVRGSGKGRMSDDFAREIDADLWAVTFMNNAGFNVGEATKFLKALDNSRKGFNILTFGIEMVDEHMPAEDRIRYIDEAISQGNWRNTETTLRFSDKTAGELFAPHNSVPYRVISEIMHVKDFDELRDLVRLAGDNRYIRNLAIMQGIYSICIEHHWTNFINLQKDTRDYLPWTIVSQMTSLQYEYDAFIDFLRRSGVSPSEIKLIEITLLMNNLNKGTRQLDASVRLCCEETIKSLQDALLEDNSGCLMDFQLFDSAFYLLNPARLGDTHSGYKEYIKGYWSNVEAKFRQGIYGWRDVVRELYLSRNHFALMDATLQKKDACSIFALRPMIDDNKSDDEEKTVIINDFKREYFALTDRAGVEKSEYFYREARYAVRYLLRVYRERQYRDAILENTLEELLKQDRLKEIVLSCMAETLIFDINNNNYGFIDALGALQPESSLSQSIIAVFNKLNDSDTTGSTDERIDVLRICISVLHKRFPDESTDLLSAALYEQIENAIESRLKGYYEAVRTALPENEQCILPDRAPSLLFMQLVCFFAWGGNFVNNPIKTKELITIVSQLPHDERDRLCMFINLPSVRDQHILTHEVVKSAKQHDSEKIALLEEKSPCATWDEFVLSLAIRSFLENSGCNDPVPAMSMLETMSGEWMRFSTVKERSPETQTPISTNSVRMYIALARASRSGEAEKDVTIKYERIFRTMFKLPFYVDRTDYFSSKDELIEGAFAFILNSKEPFEDILERITALLPPSVTRNLYLYMLLMRDVRREHPRVSLFNIAALGKIILNDDALAEKLSAICPYLVSDTKLLTNNLFLIMHFLDRRSGMKQSGIGATDMLVIQARYIRLVLDPEELDFIPIRKSIFDRSCEFLNAYWNLSAVLFSYAVGVLSYYYRPVTDKYFLQIARKIFIKRQTDLSLISRETDFQEDDIDLEPFLELLEKESEINCIILEELGMSLKELQDQPAPRSTIVTALNNLLPSYRLNNAFAREFDLPDEIVELSGDEGLFHSGWGASWRSYEESRVKENNIKWIKRYFSKGIRPLYDKDQVRSIIGNYYTEEIFRVVYEDPQLLWVRKLIIHILSIYRRLRGIKKIDMFFFDLNHENKAAQLSAILPGILKNKLKSMLHEDTLAFTEKCSKLQSYLSVRQPSRDEHLCALYDFEIKKLRDDLAHEDLSPESARNRLEHMRLSTKLFFNEYFINTYLFDLLSIDRGLAAKSCKKLTLDEEISLIVAYFPEKSSFRDDLLKSILPEAEIKEDYLKIKAMIYDDKTSLLDETERRDELFVEEKLKIVFKNLSVTDKKDILLWVLGASDKPLYLQEYEEMLGVSFSRIKDSFSVRYDSDRYPFAGESSRNMVIDQLFMGQEGIINDPQVFNEFMDRIISAMMSKTKMRKSVSRRTFMAIYKSVMKSTDKRQKMEIVRAIAFNCAPLLENPGKNSENEVICKLLESFGIIGIKVAQIIAYSGDISVPEELRKALLELGSNARPLTKTVAFETLINMNQEDIVRVGRMLGSASIKIVYEAWLKDGRRVALKIKRPDVAHYIEKDLETFINVCADLRKKGINVPEGFEHRASTGIREDADFFREKKNTRRLQEQLWGNDETGTAGLNHKTGYRLRNGMKVEFHVPKIHEKGSNGKIIVTELIEGIDLGNERALIEQKVLNEDELTELRHIVFDFLMTQLFTDRLYLSDPHGGNFRIKRNEKDGTIQVYLLDVGAVDSISSQNDPDAGAVVSEDDYAAGTFVELLKSLVYLSRGMRTGDKYLWAALFFKKTGYLTADLANDRILETIFSKIPGEIRKKRPCLESLDVFKSYIAKNIISDKAQNIVHLFAGDAETIKNDFPAAASFWQDKTQQAWYLEFPYFFIGPAYKNIVKLVNPARADEINSLGHGLIYFDYQMTAILALVFGMTFSTGNSGLYPLALAVSLTWAFIRGITFALSHRERSDYTHLTALGVALSLTLAIPALMIATGGMAALDSNLILIAEGAAANLLGHKLFNHHRSLSILKSQTTYIFSEQSPAADIIRQARRTPNGIIVTAYQGEEFAGEPVGTLMAGEKKISIYVTRESGLSSILMDTGGIPLSECIEPFLRALSGDHVFRQAMRRNFVFVDDPEGPKHAPAAVILGDLNIPGSARNNIADHLNITYADGIVWAVLRGSPLETLARQCGELTVIGQMWGETSSLNALENTCVMRRAESVSRPLEYLIRADASQEKFENRLKKIASLGQRVHLRYAAGTRSEALDTVENAKIERQDGSRCIPSVIPEISIKEKIMDEVWFWRTVRSPHVRIDGLIISYEAATCLTVSELNELNQINRPEFPVTIMVRDENEAQDLRSKLGRVEDNGIQLGSAFDARVSGGQYAIVEVRELPGMAGDLTRILETARDKASIISLPDEIFEKKHCIENLEKELLGILPLRPDNYAHLMHAGMNLPDGQLPLFAGNEQMFKNLAVLLPESGRSEINMASFMAGVRESGILNGRFPAVSEEIKRRFAAIDQARDAEKIQQELQAAAGLIAGVIAASLEKHSRSVLHESAYQRNQDRMHTAEVMLKAFRNLNNPADTINDPLVRYELAREALLLGHMETAKQHILGINNIHGDNLAAACDLAAADSYLRIKDDKDIQKRFAELKNNAAIIENMIPQSAELSAVKTEALIIIRDTNGDRALAMRSETLSSKGFPKAFALSMDLENLKKADRKLKEIDEQVAPATDAIRHLLSAA